MNALVHRRIARADGQVVEYFGDGAEPDARASVLVVAGDDEEVVDAVRRILCDLPAGLPVVAVGSRSGSVNLDLRGDPLDPDVWALVRARHHVDACLLVNTDEEAPPNLRAARRTAREGTPMVVGWPERPSGAADVFPEDLLILAHPGRPGLIGLSDAATWIERREHLDRVPPRARRRPFAHVDDVARAYAAALVAARASRASGMWTVGPCPIWDPSDAPPGRGFFHPRATIPGSEALPAGRSVSALWGSICQEGDGT